MSDPRKFVHQPCVDLFRSSGSNGRLRQFPNFPRQVNSFRSNECICDRSEYEPSVNDGVTSPAQKRRVQRFLGLASRLVCMEVRQRMWNVHHRGARVVGCRTATVSAEAVSQIHEPR